MRKFEECIDLVCKPLSYADWKALGIDIEQNTAEYMCGHLKSLARGTIKDQDGGDICKAFKLAAKIWQIGFTEKNGFDQELIQRVTDAMYSVVVNDCIIEQDGVNGKLIALARPDEFNKTSQIIGARKNRNKRQQEDDSDDDSNSFVSVVITSGDPENETNCGPDYMRGDDNDCVFMWFRQK